MSKREEWIAELCLGAGRYQCVVMGRKLEKNFLETAGKLFSMAKPNKGQYPS